MSNQSKIKKLAGNSLLFAIGNLGSKLITFLMLPLYTWKLSQGDFGISDLALTTISLLLPIVSLSVFDSVLRFSIEPDCDKRIIFTNSLFVSIIGSVVLFFLIPIAQMTGIDFVIYVILILITQLFQSLFSQYAKSTERIKVFAINGIIVSFLTAGLNILLLVIFNLGIQGFLLSILIANFLSDIWLWKTLSLTSDVNFSMISKKEIKKLLRYSIPLIPNSIALWTTSTISRYFILFFIGVQANGLFAVANKIPSLLGVLNTIFFQAWQITAIEEFGSVESEKFYSKIFNFYSEFLFVGTSLILLFLKPLINILVSPEFQISWKYVPFLLLTVVYSSFSGFLGNYYAAAKQTKGIFTTTIVGALMNVLGNFIFIPLFGLMGAGFSSALSFFVLWIIRQYDTKKYIHTKLNVINLFQNNLVILIQISLLYLSDGILSFVLGLICLLFLLVVNKNLIVTLINLLFRKYIISVK